ncbi:MAG TPA: hypothetical protein VN777_13685 [Terriglobales bacterium]|nr:hypothetical protein [Terriglobales bacterium]
MLSKIVRMSCLVLVTVLVLGCMTWAQTTEVAANPATHTLTIVIKGTIGPILSGVDPLGLDGKNGTVKILASESLSPKKHTSTSATYELPAGAIKVTAGDNHFSTTSPSKMIINLKSTADTLTLVVAGPDGVIVTDTTFLAKGSWTNAVLKHPGVFTPSPQKLTSAKTAGGPGCKLKYVIEGLTTVLGFSGTASNSETEDPVLPNPDADHYEVD